ncbi:ATP-grasp domain-containing protein [Pseudomonas sp. Fl5BN2]|uniref:ATP-grasp domain-containing protein n=1 Tax=unclassified Pseudomonas TaxID=196821 RepID=UPI0013790011|nr:MULTISPECIES: ATP-grasp domain-containing protein [unclassified Pseudomonas]NBF04557.1 ATP-grasp domain-containing protein [Pseudomonas sp. Fl5BN2]NBF11528.1 ATP-grasp domain-containing protein [Pseudomonas sp. Fl4BN1]
MRLLYPSDPFDPKRPDEHYLEEYAAVLAAGLSASLFSFEDFESGRFKASPALQPGERVLYRGWMLTPQDYASLVQHLHDKEAVAFTSAAEYQRCHHLPEWYPLLAPYTSETLVLAADADFTQALAGLNWPGYFIKDYVKSLNTGSGSLVDRPEDIAPLIEQMRQYRGQIEGGICVRRREDYLADSERRYFVLNGQACAASGEVPALVQECAALIDSRFFSVDVILRSDGVLRLVELGDGQVSDRKEWTAQHFAKMLGAVA